MVPFHKVLFLAGAGYFAWQLWLGLKCGEVHRRAHWKEMRDGNWYGVVVREEAPISFAIHMLMYLCCFVISVYGALAR